MSEEAPSPVATPAGRLGTLYVSLREDLEVTRHVFRGAVSYVIRDPITFQSQRVDPADYEVLINLDGRRPLGELFDDLVAQGKAAAEQEAEFYQFILQLHRLGFLHLPIADSHTLYRRYELKRRAKRKEKLLGFLFLRIPLWRPDKFLERTVRFVRPIFTRWTFAVWLVVLSAAGYVAVQRWGELRQPLQGLLVSRNLVLMWMLLIVLKVFHEFGHAFACKHYGGFVPEMGAYLVVFTPCAYVDATASWGFTKRRHRLIVCLAGVYVESFIAAMATFVWAMTEPSLMHDLAYKVIVLAGVVTVLFNVNPLMRYDGYYVLSDLLEIPNLRMRSTRCVLDAIKRLVLRVSPPSPSITRRVRFILLAYGVSTTIYRICLFIAIAAILATRMALMGLVFGVMFLAGLLVGNIRKLMRYLWHSEETAPVRGRAVVFGAFALVVLPVLFLFTPMPSHVVADGVVATEEETVIRAKSSGFLQKTYIQEGQLVAAGQSVADLADDVFEEEVAEDSARLRAALIRRDAYQIDRPDRALQEEERATALRTALERSRQRQADLNLLAPRPGRVVRCLDDRELGKYLQEGTAVATIVSGGWEVRAMLTEAELLNADPHVGDPVEFRSVAEPGSALAGEVVRVAPGGSRAALPAPLTHLGGGSIAVDPHSGEASEPFFEVVVRLAGDSSRHVRHGLTGQVLLRGANEPLASSALRRLNRFVVELTRE